MIETPHIQCLKSDIAKIVLMPGDPKRAEFIAKTYLDNCKLVNNVRGMLAYTGTYKGKKITIFSSGMGMPSMGIYAYELYKYFDVENIIRIGSCGSNNKDIKLLDVILSTSSYNEGEFAYTFNNKHIHEAYSDEYLNNIILNTAGDLNINLRIGKTICSEVFDLYMEDVKVFLNRMPEDSLASEMEAFALFYIASTFGKKAACLLTVSDSKYDKKVVSALDRQNSLTNMIELALESCLKVGEYL